MLEFRNVAFSYGKEELLNDCTFTLKKGDFAMMLGANGAGKSTILNLANGQLRPGQGTVLLDGQNVAEMPPLLRAKKIATVFQSYHSMTDFSVEEVVQMGRNPHRSRFGGLSRTDREEIDRALDLMSLQFMRMRLLRHLSGGERQRVMIAAALARKTDYLLLDEPTAAADPAYRVSILRTLRDLPWKPGILIATHDITAAELFAEKILMLYRGSFLASEKMTAENIRTVYGNDATCLLRRNEP